MTENMGKKLFTQFPSVSTREWEELINTDLKGADYDKKLVWQTPEGIPLRPYYRVDQIKDIDHLDSLPGEFPFVRGKKTSSNDWLVRQDIHVDDTSEANVKALDALMKGAGSIGFVFSRKTGYTPQAISRLLSNICMASAELNFYCGNHSMEILQAVDRENTTRGGALSGLHGCIEYDPVGEMLTTGNFAAGEQESFDLAGRLVEFSKKLPNFGVINVNAANFHNSGGSAVHELAFAMSSAAEYLQRLTSGDLTAGEVAGKIRFTFATGSNYFMEIAKFRAIRYLWAKMLEAWDVSPDIAGKVFIHAETSRWNKTIYDPYVNMLRSTTESMSAVLGGIDSLTVDPFDKHFKKQSPFSERIARNTQLVLKEEAYFDKVADPGAGSYYIESLTSSLIDESWNLFLQTQEAGGITEAFKKGFIQDKIEETAAKRNTFIAGRRDVLLGTNQYPDANEKALKNVDMSIAWPAPVHAEVQLARPLRLYRGAMAFEELRLRTEKNPGSTPKVFLLPYGSITMGKARAGFSSGFFACAGFEIIENPVFSSPEEGVRAALKSKADIVVLCSSDEEYSQIIPSVTSELIDKAILVVAGNPKESALQLKEAGVKQFIHLRSDVLETLKQFQGELSIK